MNRRSLLRTAPLLLLPGTAGCNRLAASVDDSTDSYVADWDCEFTRGGDMCRRVSLADVDHFVYLVEENTVRIEGCHAYGSPNCDAPAVLGVDYDEAADQLVVRFGSKDGLNALEELVTRGCQAALAAASYSMTVWTSETIPTTVRVVESEGGSDRSATYRL